MVQSPKEWSEPLTQESDAAEELKPPDIEKLRAIAAGLAAALGQIDVSALPADTVERIERARSTSKLLTRTLNYEVGAQKVSNVDSSSGWPDLVGYHVLLAVHDSDRLNSLGRMLAEMGARYELARDGIAAHTLLHGSEFDFAVIDDELTDGSGREVISRIRTVEGKVAAMPVLALCAEDSAVAKRALLDAGANLVLTTASLAHFAHSVATIIADTEKAEPVPGSFLLDRDRFERLLEIAGEDGAVELLERLLEDLRQVEQGLERALADQNAAETRTQTHVLVALAGAIGAEALQRLTERLNSAAHHRSPDELSALGYPVLRHLTQLIRLLAEHDQAPDGSLERAKRPRPW